MDSYCIGTRCAILDLERYVDLLTHTYVSQEVVDALDVRVMLRVPHDVLKHRRHERHGYHTAGTLTLDDAYPLRLPFSLVCSDRRKD